MAREQARGVTAHIVSHDPDLQITVTESRWGIITSVMSSSGGPVAIISKARRGFGAVYTGYPSSISNVAMASSRAGSSSTIRMGVTPRCPRGGLRANRTHPAA